MNLFGKKRIAELEKENKKLQEEKDGALMLKDTTIKNHEQLVHKYRSLKAGSDGLKAVMESKNKKYGNEQGWIEYDRLKKKRRDAKKGVISF